MNPLDLLQLKAVPGRKKFSPDPVKKKLILFLFLAFAVVSCLKLSAQEKFGKTLNVGLGTGYYSGIGSFPALTVNYEIDAARNFTLAPFITFSSYRNYVWWGNPNYEYRNYYYRQTIVPVGVKGTYYFDELLDAGDAWDFYAAASLGFAFRTTTWENGYHGESVQSSAGPMYATIHVGTEYHLNSKVGLFLDLSSGMSSIGLAIHPSEISGKNK